MLMRAYGILLFFWVFVLLVPTAQIWAQSEFSPEVDSLWRIASTSKETEQKVDSYNDLAHLLYRSHTDTAMFCAKNALSLAEKLDYKKGQAEAHRRIGVILVSNGFANRALESYNKALDLFKSMNDKQGQGLVYNNFGQAYRRLGQFPKSVNYYLQARQIALETQDYDILSKIYNNIGIIFSSIGEYDSAISYYYRSLDMKAKYNTEDDLSSTYTNIGIVKLSLRDYQSAEEYFEKAMEYDVAAQDGWGIANGFENIGLVKIGTEDLDEATKYFTKALDGFEDLKDRSGIAANLNYLGETLLKKGELSAAIDYLEKSRVMYEEIGNKRGSAVTLINLATCFKKMNNLDSAIHWTNKAFEIASEIGAMKEAVEASELLYNLYGQMGDQKNLYRYAQQYIALKDSLFDHQKIEYIARLESKQQLSIVQQENELLLKDNQLKINELQASNLKIARQNTTQVALFICLIFALLTAFFWYRFNLRKQKTIGLLRTLNDEITRQKEQIAEQASELEKVNGEMKNMNKSLEVLVTERTKKIESQNKKLRDYAFSNSHEVRAPLANLLGLINVSKIQGISPEEQEEIIEKIYISALDLDSVITKVNKILEEERL